MRLPMKLPLITLKVHEALLAARAAGTSFLECSVDLGRSTVRVDVNEASWHWQGTHYPYLKTCKDRTIYFWTG